MRDNIKTPEYNFVLYIFSFMLLKLIISYIPKYSTIILFGTLGLILVRSIYYNHHFNKKKINKWLLFNLFFFVIFGINKLINDNDILGNYIINFIIYATIPLFMLINVNDYKKVIYYYFVFSVITGALLIFDPFFNYQLTGGYMEYGFDILMYSIMGLVLGNFYLKKRWNLIFIIIEIIFIAIWGNKGALISALVLFISFEFFYGKSIKKILMIVLLSTILINISTIVTYSVELLKKCGFDTYSINTFQDLFSKDAVNVTSARTDIWLNSINYIKESPIIGNGIGTFETKTGKYVHNVFLDIFVTFGLLSFMLFILVLIYEIYRIIKEKNYEKKMFTYCCLVVSLIPMQISLSFWNVILFWIFEGIEILSNDKTKYMKGIKNE